MRRLASCCAIGVLYCWVSVAMGAGGRARQASCYGPSEGWDRVAALMLINRLQEGRSRYLAGVGGEVMDDRDGYVHISLNEADGIRTGDILEVTYPLTTHTEEGRYCGPGHAATLWVAAAQADRSLAKVVEKRVQERLDQPQFRVGFFRNQRCPVSVQSGDPSASYGSIASQLASALEERLETSSVFSLVDPDGLAVYSVEARRGSVMIDQGDYVYVNLNRADGLSPGDQLAATHAHTSRQPDGILRVGPASAATLHVMRVDPAGSLCAVKDRSLANRLDDRQAGVTVKCDRSAGSTLAAVEQADRPHLIVLTVGDSDGEALSVKAILVRADGGQPIAQTVLRLSSRTLLPVRQTPAVESAARRPAERTPATRQQPDSYACPLAGLERFMLGIPYGTDRRATNKYHPKVKTAKRTHWR